MQSGDMEKAHSHRRYMLQDFPLCRLAAAEVLQCGKGTVTKLTQQILTGQVNAARDLRLGGREIKMTKMESQQVLNAETMWCWIHSFMAEPLAEGVGKPKLDVAQNVKQLLKMDPVSEVFDGSKLEPRHMHPNVTLTELRHGNYWLRFFFFFCCDG